MAALLDGARKLFFAVAGGILLLLAVLLVGAAAYDLLRAFVGIESLVSTILGSIGILIVAIAVYDLASFLIEEELVRDPELRSLEEARRSLNKFFTIIILALLLEGIVLVFETKLEATEKLIYPTLLILAGVAALIGLGLFQRLTFDAGRQEKPEPEPGA